MPDYPEDLDHPLSRGELSLLGVGWREISGPLWRPAFRGVHVWSATDPATPLQRALDASALVPEDGALGGWAAAQVGGVSELDGGLGTTTSPVPLCVQPSTRRRRGPAVVPWRSPLTAEDMTTVGGVRVTLPVRTAFDLARFGSLQEGVVALDVLGRGRPTFLEEVAAYADARRRWHGVPQVRRAISLATPRARSPRETTFRLFWVLDCLLPAPEVNAVVRAADGFLLGMGDLLDPVTGLLGEYDGSHHRQPDQHAQDNAREEGLEEAGLTVVRVTGVDLGRFRARTRVRLRTRWQRAGRSPRGDWTWEPGPLPTPVPHWG